MMCLGFVVVVVVESMPDANKPERERERVVSNLGKYKKDPVQTTSK
jgi:hypothetical protein